ncbi:MAG: 60S ribosomal export protein NMD3 [Methanomicrobiaceae archaeon]|nr:60S ribosomal export protein NMD3 [Methanomicrobiaceae archaeon]
MRESFCPKCGAPSEEGLCPRCMVDATEWLVCESRVTQVVCPSCGSVKQAGAWTDVEQDPADLSAALAMSAVHVHEDVTDLAIAIETREPSPNRTVAAVSVRGTLYGLSVEDTCRVEIAWKKEQCDRCSRYSGGYYEAVLQVRAADRKPDIYELEKAAGIAEASEAELQASGDRFAFVLKVDEHRDGLDIFVGSQHLADLVSRGIVQELGGKYSTHPKLVGERDGRKLYRVTYAIRLPCYQKGDVVLMGKRYCEIRDMEKNQMRIFDLKDGTMRTVREDCGNRPIGNVRDAANCLCAYIDGPVAGILDPETFSTREVAAYPWLHLAEGSYVRVLKDAERDRLVPVG